MASIFVRGNQLRHAANDFLGKRDDGGISLVARLRLDGWYH